MHGSINDYAQIKRWFCRRPVWITYLGLLASGAMLIIDIFWPDPLPFVDEVTLFGLTFFFINLLRERHGKNQSYD